MRANYEFSFQEFIIYNCLLTPKQESTVKTNIQKSMDKNCLVYSIALIPEYRIAESEEGVKHVTVRPEDRTVTDIIQVDNGGDLELLKKFFHTIVEISCRTTGKTPQNFIDEFREYLNFEPRMCNSCHKPHVQNCPRCYGFGLKPVTSEAAIAEGLRELPVKASEAEEGSAPENWTKCPVCGGTPV